MRAPDQVPEGLAKSDWQSIRAASEAGRHSANTITSALATQAFAPARVLHDRFHTVTTASPL